MKATSSISRNSYKFWFFLIFVVFVQSCYHYRVLSTVSDPSNEYSKKILWSYCWGLVNNPQQFVVPNCDRDAIDEVRITTNFGYSLITVVTVGILCPVKVEWKCHKPCQRVGNM
jgi:hypothetical protein